MKRDLIALLIAGLIPITCAGFDEAGELHQARKATAEFGGALKAELMAAMQSGGALNAIDVCNIRAVEISDEVSLATGMNLSRVSQRNRNPDNAPNDWQTAVLMDFESRKQAGEAADSLSWHEVASTGAGQEFRFMKAIPTGGLCLQCHGTAIAPPVAEKLAELYPGDKATGFEQGDLRGAFVITRQLDQAGAD